MFVVFYVTCEFLVYYKIHHLNSGISARSFLKKVHTIYEESRLQNIQCLLLELRSSYSKAFCVQIDFRYGASMSPD